ncbi:DUF1062 domain-containing protein [uncultured Psychroserpens sp.]|uniref:DUF1062 domain-containing protein n=1 Tax=uncultured Psychroserpens sp. TaxID=255436 RepID=UPI00261781E7|nr:DUF1062 domain-containing protein [uncultured Psychroserpens sp.]
MRNEYTWEIKAISTPLLIKKCSHCHNDRFYCSEKFRLNAQKKNIDVWLIYRCKKCDNTINMTIFSRIKTSSINKRLYKQLSENQTQAAWKYAFSYEIKQKNNIELDFKSVEYKILHDNITLEDILSSDIEIITFKIKYPFDFNLKLSSVIRACLKISSKQLERLIEWEVISIQEKYLQKKHKVKNESIIKIEVRKLKHNMESKN